jgi:hypothetical protein
MTPAMEEVLHITNGDAAGHLLSAADLTGEVLVWRDILYDGPRTPGWPDDEALTRRAAFLSEATGGGLEHQEILSGLRRQYRRLTSLAPDDPVVLWFDACLFDQSMLVHILTCLRHTGHRATELVCIDAYPGIVPFNGLGQLAADQLAACYPRRRPVSDAQFRYAETTDRAFASRDMEALSRLSRQTDAPLPWIPAAATRWLQEQPDPHTGLGRLEFLTLEAVRAGHRTPGEIFSAVAAADTPPQYWGDTTLWAVINRLADRTPPLVTIAGPATRLPQWNPGETLRRFTIGPGSR